MKVISKTYLKDLVYHINGAAIEVHKHLGPGLLESVYHKCLAHEFKLRGIAFCSELFIPVEYKDLELDTRFKCDFLVENEIVIELKAAESILPIHIAFLINHMKLLEMLFLISLFPFL